MSNIEFVRTLDIKKRYDVIVCGGGVAGVSAAVDVAKRGKSVLLLEKSIILGGLATLGLINLFVPMCNGRGKQIIFGNCERWVRESVKYGYDTIPEPWKNGEPKQPTDQRYLTWFSPYIFAAQLTEEVSELGIDLLYDCTAAEPIMDGKVCRGVVTLSKAGLEYYECKMLIDTTGDLDIMRRAGVPIKAGENFATYSGKMITLAGCKRALESGNIYDAYSVASGFNASLYGHNQPSGVPRWSGLSAEDVTDYMIRNQRELIRRIRDDDRISRDVASVPMMPQFRTTAHIIGDYTFTVDDVYRHFDDSVCAINDFDNRDYLFEVPFRTLVRDEFPNMITAGRSASAEGYGWDVLRVIPPAILTGQAAAQAACIAIDDGTPIARVDIRKLQCALESRDVMVHFPDEYLPDDRSFAIGGKRVDIGHN